MQFNYALQPELMRLSDKDQETLSILKQKLYKIFELLPQLYQRQVYPYIDKMQMMIHLIYYSLTFLRNHQTIGEEYTNVIPYNDVDYNERYTQITRSRRVLFLLLSLFPYTILKFLKNKYQSIQQEHSYLPDSDQVITSVLQFHLSIFMIFGQYYEIAKRITSVQYVFTRQLPTHGLNYQRIGKFYLILQIIQFSKFTYNTIKKYQQHHKQVIVQTSNEVNQNQKCKLCYDEATNLTCTSCGHLFCWTCILKWLQTKQICPICRQPIKPNQLLQIQ
ncbi:hypothetical protein pb186bvf_015819 [Paramecium bursaria]